jgi:hypothetical protein
VNQSYASHFRSLAEDVEDHNAVASCACGSARDHVDDSWCLYCGQYPRGRLPRRGEQPHTSCLSVQNADMAPPHASCSITSKLIQCSMHGPFMGSCTQQMGPTSHTSLLMCPAYMQGHRSPHRSEAPLHPTSAILDHHFSACMSHHDDVCGFHHAQHDH